MFGELLKVFVQLVVVNLNAMFIQLELGFKRRIYVNILVSFNNAVMIMIFSPAFSF